ncbi:MAG: ABC transporter substrate-binding protein [Mesorhizobium sp.]|nr:ABC transporter substrate-binding protein [Mesorhizobium sp.]MCO5160966.1 ABC transporter substrate-binding protein [Mesorhizobium sp.]
MKLFRRLITAAAMISAALFTFPALAGAPMGDGGTVRLMSNPVGTQSYPPFVIKKFELDKKYGFTLEVIPFTNPQASVAALQSESIEVVVQDWITVARLRNQNIPVIGVAPFLAYVNTLLLPAESEIKSLADLKGKTLGTYTKTGFDWIILQAVAKQKYGFDLAKEVTLQEGAPSLLRGSLEQGQVDATLMYNSLTPDMILSGKAKLMMTIHDVVAEMGLSEAPFLMYSMREAYAKEKPGNAKAFVAAYQEAIDILLSNPDVWMEQGANMKLAPEATAMFRDNAAKEFIKAFTPGMAEVLNKTFEVLLATAGPEIMGMTAMPDKVLTLDYQP